MVICLAAALRALPPGGRPGAAWLITAAVAGAVLAARLFMDAAATLDLAAATLLAAAALSVGRAVLVRRAWRAGAFAIAIAVVTASGAYFRAYRLDEIAQSPDRRLQADVVYYQQQALHTANPFAAGEKSPLWPALHAPLVQTFADRDLAMRLPSWSFGILMLPAVAVGIGLLFGRVPGIIVAGTLAVDSWLIDLCTQGLREEMGVCLWMGLLVLLFATGNEPREQAPRFTWRRTLLAGTTAGTLLLLRNTDLPVVLLLTGYALFRAPVEWPKRLAGLLLPVAVVTPFYVNQWRTYGDAFHLEKRDARYHANMEFRGRTPPPGLSMPSPEEHDRDFYAGEPLSPAAYLFRFHPLREVAANQWNGLRHVVSGEPFSATASYWLRMACAAGLIATLLRRRERFAALFVAGSVLGMRAHLISVGPFEARLLLPVMVVWLASGWWLIAAAARAGGRNWLLAAEASPAQIVPVSHTQETR